jgi:hypothetical protein
MCFAESHRISWSSSLRVLLVVSAIAGLALVGFGCSSRPRQQPKLTPRYTSLPAKKLPAYLQGTILERVDLMYTEPMPVSGYGLIANLYGTGDTRAPNAVRDYMIREMQRRGFGSRQLGFEHLTPENVLRDPSFAIVRVDGWVPAGARVGQRFDVRVSAMENNDTSSLAHGQLYRTELKIDGANPRSPGVAIDRWAFAEGDAFVNPAYALAAQPDDSAARNSLREAIVLGGGLVQIDRPIAMRLRQPEFRLARMIDQRLDEFLQDESYAQAKDEGRVWVTMPPKYNGDWEHFTGVITHVYFNSAPSFIAAKAQELAAEATKPDAPLLDISYCWEALGQQAMPFVTPLMTHPRPEVAYAAARAAAFCGEVSSQTVLIEMARTQDHPFQLNAVQTLAKLPNSPEINGMLRSLLHSPHTLVRIEAYRALAAARDASIFSREIEGKFVLDIVPGDGPPLIYASRQGWPARLAVFGRKPALDLPVTFTAMDGKLSISSTPGRKTVTIFYRGPGVRKAVSIESNPDIAEIAARLGGAGPREEIPLPFTYCDVVAIVQGLADQQKVVSSGSGADGMAAPVAFVLQESPIGQDEIMDAPPIPGAEPPQRPQSDSPGTVSSALPARPQE